MTENSQDNQEHQSYMFMCGHQTPVHISAMCGSNEVMQIFVEYGTKALESTDGCGRTPLHVAAMCGYVDIVETLTKAGVDTSITDDHGHTALDLATMAQAALELSGMGRLDCSGACGLDADYE